MKNIITILGISIFAFCSIQCKKEKKEDTKTKEIIAEKQLNITFLLDLSDRIDPSLYPNSPEHYQRDQSIVNDVVGIFKSYMIKQGAYKTKGKIKVIVNPVPKDHNINKIMEEMTIDLSGKETKPAEKKKIFKNIDSIYSKNISKVYDLTIKQSNYIGSDIWRFFKNDIDKAIVNQENYRNILIVITDGYLYHQDSKIKDKNRTSFLLPKVIRENGFRDNNNWKEKFEQGDYGFITTRNDLENLEVLVLEVNATPKNDDDIIKTYLSKWFEEMGIKKYEIYGTGLSNETKPRIEQFIGI